MVLVVVVVCRNYYNYIGSFEVVYGNLYGFKIGRCIVFNFGIVLRVGNNVWCFGRVWIFFIQVCGGQELFKVFNVGSWVVVFMFYIVVGYLFGIGCYVYVFVFIVNGIGYCIYCVSIVVVVIVGYKVV